MRSLSPDFIKFPLCVIQMGLESRSPFHCTLECVDSFGRLKHPAGDIWFVPKPASENLGRDRTLKISFAH
jgi:hypothetical protein